MGYKRKARILFLGDRSVVAAQLAATLANTLGDDLLETQAIGELSLKQQRAIRTALLESGIEYSASPSLALDETMLHWADLLVLMDEMPLTPSQLPAGLQLRHYPFPSPGDSAQDYRALRDAVHHRVESIIGGIKLLTKAS